MRLARTTAIAAILCSASARAADHPMVELDLDPCVGDTDEIRRVVMVELAGLLADRPDASGDRTHASATCDGPRAMLQVDDPITRRSLRRSVDLAGAPTPGRPRLLALALVELIASSWTELEPAPPALTATAVEPLAPPSLVDRAAARSLEVSVTGGAIRFGDIHVLDGAAVRVADHSSALIGWMIDAQYHHGFQAAGLGKSVIHTDIVDLGAAARLHRAWAAARFDLGAGFRAGAVRMTGAPDQTMTTEGSGFWASWVGALVTGAVSYQISDRVSIDATVETGYVIEPVGALVDGRRAVAVDGPWLEAQLGIGFLL